MVTLDRSYHYVSRRHHFELSPRSSLHFWWQCHNDEEERKYVYCLLEEPICRGLMIRSLPTPRNSGERFEVAVGRICDSSSLPIHLLMLPMPG